MDVITHKFYVESTPVPFVPLVDTEIGIQVGEVFAAESQFFPQENGVTLRICVKLNQSQFRVLEDIEGRPPIIMRGDAIGDGMGMKCYRVVQIETEEGE